MTIFGDEIAAARATNDPQSYIDRVKQAVRNEFARIDDSAVLDDTLYFNHSAVPDFVIKWPDHSERRLYLRNSFESIVASGDAVRFNPAKPVVLALSRDERKAVVDDMAEQSRSAPDTLVSDSTAFDAIAESPGKDVGHDRDAVGERNPVAGLIRSNLARGGRGLLTADRVSALLNVQPLEPNGPVSSYVERLEENFSPESVARITQTALLVQVALSGDVSILAEANVAASNLSVSEINDILPWILENPTVTDEVVFWQYIGSIVSFVDVMRMKEAVEGRDLTRLVQANLTSWSGKRAYIGLESLASENPAEASSKIREDGIWSIIGPTLGVNFEGSRLHLAPTGTAIRGRDGRSAVLWQDLSAALSDFKVSSVRLRGIARSIRINAEESDDVSQDVDAVTDSVDDTYYVGRLGLSFPVTDEEGAIAGVDVDFDSLIISSERPVALFNLAAAALRLLRYRDPVSEGVENLVLGATFGATPSLPAVSET